LRGLTVSVGPHQTNAIDLNVGRPIGIVKIDDAIVADPVYAIGPVPKAKYWIDIADQLLSLRPRRIAKRAFRRHRQKDLVMILQVLADAGQVGDDWSVELGQVIGGSDP